MQHDLQLRAAARAIYDACYPTEESVIQPALKCSMIVSGSPTYVRGTHQAGSFMLPGPADLAL